MSNMRTDDNRVSIFLTETKPGMFFGTGEVNGTELSINLFTKKADGSTMMTKTGKRAVVLKVAETEALSRGNLKAAVRPPVSTATKKTHKPSVELVEQEDESAAVSSRNLENLTTTPIKVLRKSNASPFELVEQEDELEL